MRKTRDSLIADMPYWNEQRHDIVKVNYGDEPLTYWDHEKYEWVSNLTGTLSKIHAIEAYMYYMNGNYYIYDTFVGKSYIKEDGVVLTGNVNITYRGKRYNIFLSKMYGKNGLSITRIDADGIVSGWSNADGLGSCARRDRTKELDYEVIEKVINNPMEDYGIGIQKLMEVIRETYYADIKNHIMEKCFEL